MRCAALAAAAAAAGAGAAAPYAHHHRSARDRARPRRNVTRGSPWQGLRDGLDAWTAFGFDGAVTYRVTEGWANTQVLFNYPGDSPDKAPVGGGEVTISIEGAEGELLRQVTAPFVRLVMAGRDPSDPAGSGSYSVPRAELLAQGGGMTLPALAERVGRARTTRPAMRDYALGWEPLRDALDAWAAMRWDVDFTFNVGTVDETLFTYTKGSTDINIRLPGASLSKWPAASMISGLVADGTLSFGDRASRYLPWWTQDPADPRSQITLRHLLTFQSGYQDDPQVDCAQNPAGDYLSCAEKLYQAAGEVHTQPGTSFAYISAHLQFAGAMAVAASGLSPDRLFDKYLYTPLGMGNTTWGPWPHKNPQMATGITTTGADFERMLRGMLSYEFLGRDVLGEMERDWSVAPVSPSGDGWFGHYAMGHWLDCLGYGAGQSYGASAALPMRCLEENVQAGPGAYGYFPLIDRNRGYYMQIVLAEDSECRSEIPEYLRAASKPMVDAIVAGKHIEEATLLAAGGGLTLPEITDIYNYIPPQCQPYRTMQ